MPLEDNYASPASRVYISYDVDSPPEHPGPDWTRFVCVSDTHSRKYRVPPGDVLLHSGDLSSWGYLPHLESSLTWIESLPHPVKVIIAGNHDLCLDEQWAEGGHWANQAGEGIPLKEAETARAKVRSEATRAVGIHYLEYQSTSITTKTGRTWEIYGSPATPRYALGAFQYESGTLEGEEIYSRIPITTEILLTHTPPFGICDVTRREKNAGCPALAAKLASGDLSHLKLHVYGHIHEGHGVEVQPAIVTDLQRIHVNAAVPDNLQATIVDLLN
ncbi:uncharacterized protein PHACADRAFT_208636 [Phanerochaete carnosa HHB-10118-sp]|uniref:Calcineurin-like phosphoesterase domain-containing protein n=1 Tax=Phanerochaete carnosa (strain HHB-10118-sp) TaxID=650164 RepID=K5W809_PHACS|nr:uncharacterized protein PHACADRAFT_208636 [Phanerochaete carnosa HHB-10118-sp]EKM55114.1 hypothetical protein PHACADRAFT_208636 [Phanerochaete carnosa HHB-10118-sp]